MVWTAIDQCRSVFLAQASDNLLPPYDSLPPDFPGERGWSH